MAHATVILIPTFNEVGNIEAFLRALFREVPAADVLVIDDHSPDGTRDRVLAAMAGNSRLHLLERQEKLGLASAYLDGFGWALDRGYQQLVQMDADFSHRPEDLPRLLAGLDHADAAFGCRYIAGGATPGWSAWRRFVSRGGNIYARCVLGIPYRDLTGGFNAWKRATLERILRQPTRSRGYAFQIELKYRAHREGFRLVECPIRFEERRAGQSKISTNILVEAIAGVPRLRWPGRTPLPASSDRDDAIGDAAHGANPRRG